MPLSIPACERVPGTAPAPGRVLGEVARNRKGRVRSDGVVVKAARSSRARIVQAGYGYDPRQPAPTGDVADALRGMLIGHLFG